MKQQPKKNVWGSFLRFYTKFPIPWWLFILSFASGILYTEVGLAITKYSVMLNTGKLYNSAIIGYIFFTLLASVVSICTNMTSTYGQGIVQLRARNVVYRKLMRLSPRQFEKEQPSAYVSRVTADTAETAGAIRVISAFITSVYSFVRYYMVLFRFSPVLTWWLMLSVPIAVLTFWIVGRTQYWAQKSIYTSINTMTTFFSERLATMKHTKAQVMEERERKEGFAAIERRFHSDIINGLAACVQVTIHAIYVKATTLILVFSGRGLINNGTLPATGLNEANTYLGNVQKYLAELLTHWQTLKGVQGIIGKVAEITESESEQLKRSAEMPEQSQDIKLENVIFGYDEHVEILHGVTATIPAGKKTAIVGNNGCGKSTLFRLLMRFYEPNEGAITYGGVDTREIHLDDWRTSFGYVLQNSPLLSGTIRDNILYGCKREVSEEEIIQAAKNANAYDFIMEFPEGFDKDVGEGGTRLSGGQRQRIAIARAMITDPKLLLMDEATASLDYQSDRLIWQACEKLMEGRTTVLIAHDMSAVMKADHIIVLNSGAMEAEGTHEELMEKSATYREYVQLQNFEGGVA